MLVLFVLLAQGSRRAWFALVALDVASLLLLLLALRGPGEAPLIVHLLTGGALVCLLAPPTRRFVARRQTR